MNLIHNSSLGSWSCAWYSTEVTPSKIKTFFAAIQNFYVHLQECETLLKLSIKVYLKEKQFLMLLFSNCKQCSLLLLISEIFYIDINGCFQVFFIEERIMYFVILLHKWKLWFNLTRDGYWNKWCNGKTNRVYTHFSFSLILRISNVLPSLRSIWRPLSLPMD